MLSVARPLRCSGYRGAWREVGEVGPWGGSGGEKVLVWGLSLFLTT